MALIVALIDPFALSPKALIPSYILELYGRYSLINLFRGTL